MPIINAATQQSVNILSPESKNTNVQLNQQKVNQEKLVINVRNIKQNDAKKMTESFCGNTAGTYNTAPQTKATTMHFIKTGQWLENPSKLVRENREVKSKEVGMKIKQLKKDENLLVKEFSEKHSNNSEHIIGQSILCSKIDISDEKNKAVAQNIRTALVNIAPSYLENKALHESHTGTRWLLPTKNTKYEDTTKFNTIDQQQNLYIDHQGNEFRIINSGIGKTVEELLHHEKNRSQYNKEISNLLKNENNISAAMQMNQLEYANDSVFKESRKKTSAHNDNVVADLSFFHMIKEIQKLAFASNDVQKTLENKQEIELSAIPITPEDKIEILVSRLTATNSAYPTVAELKKVIKDIDLELPEKLNWLNSEITEKDKQMLYYNHPNMNKN